MSEQKGRPSKAALDAREKELEEREAALEARAAEVREMAAPGRFHSSEHTDDDVITERPREAYAGQRQRNVSRNNDGEPLLQFGSTVIEAEIKGNPEADVLAKQYQERLDARNPNYKPTDAPSR